MSRSAASRVTVDATAGSGARKYASSYIGCKTSSASIAVTSGTTGCGGGRQAIDADACGLCAFAISLSTPLTSVERDAATPASLPMFRRDLKAWNNGVADGTRTWVERRRGDACVMAPQLAAGVCRIDTCAAQRDGSARPRTLVAVQRPWVLVLCPGAVSQAL